MPYCLSMQGTMLLVSQFTPCRPSILHLALLPSPPLSSYLSSCSSRSCSPCTASPSRACLCTSGRVRVPCVAWPLYLEASRARAHHCCHCCAYVGEEGGGGAVRTERECISRSRTRPRRNPSSPGPYCSYFATILAFNILMPSCPPAP